MKKRTLDKLNPGQKFIFGRKLYVLDDAYTVIHIVTGKVILDSEMSRDTLVRPVKVSIQVK